MLYSFRNREPIIGKNTYISEQAVLIGDVRIGDDCYIGPGAILRADYGAIEVGDGSAVEDGVVVHSPPDITCKIGKKVTIGHGAIVHSSAIGDSATIGMGAIISIEAQVGAETTVAEGSVVRMKQIVPPSVIVGGNPAKVIRQVTKGDKEFNDYGKAAYIDLAHEYLREGLKKVETGSNAKS
ncbi:MAG: gamma carbonic anhydrase family protein [Chloroflexi bacterium]|nr:gamma carbonic anhydrase family protein [Chloroflexota bacterium]